SAGSGARGRSSMAPASACERLASRRRYNSAPDAWSGARQARTRVTCSRWSASCGMVSAARSQKRSAATLALPPRPAGRQMLFGAEHHVHGPVDLGEKFLEGEIERLVDEPLRPGEARSRHLEVARRPGRSEERRVGK